MNWNHFFYFFAFSFELLQQLPQESDGLNSNLSLRIKKKSAVHTDSKTKCEVHFIEVKSGNAALMGKQRNIKKAIQEGRVTWHEISVEANRAEIIEE